MKNSEIIFHDVIDSNGEIKPYLKDHHHDGVVAVASYQWDSFFFMSSALIVNRFYHKTLINAGKNKLTLAIYDPDEDHLFGNCAVAFDKNVAFPLDPDLTSKMVKEILAAYKIHMEKGIKTSIENFGGTII